ncbi:hypothetical protein [Gemmatimonas groenlandica]|uniref:Uncharacterized protein n=1 Tax=Gemmatimonas groenlandica TaxID=2732249 RepID=A0A6M4IM39_9BACT|nr:hypothetical protein [Gemmatimonas groenlandica]QJR34082.1 hypothetical protein HKW67_00410 [Gemmatimonas groenlandica]
MLEHSPRVCFRRLVYLSRRQHERWIVRGNGRATVDGLVNHKVAAPRLNDCLELLYGFEQVGEGRG